MMAEGSEQMNQYLTFKLDDEVFALEISKVREVLDFSDVTKVPQTLILCAVLLICAVVSYRWSICG